MTDRPAKEHRSLMTKHSLEDWTGVLFKTLSGKRLSRFKHHNLASGPQEGNRSIQQRLTRTMI